MGEVSSVLFAIYCNQATETSCFEKGEKTEKSDERIFAFFPRLTFLAETASPNSPSFAAEQSELLLRTSLR